MWSQYIPGDETPYYLYTGTQEHCTYLLSPDFRTINTLLLRNYIDYGIRTIILEASSRDSNTCFHPPKSHENGRGLDLGYYYNNWGKLLVAPTWELVSSIHQVWPSAQIIVGTVVREQLEIYTGEWLSWLTADDDNNHNFDPDDRYSHIHVGFNGSPILSDTSLIYQYNKVAMVIGVDSLKKDRAMTLSAQRWVKLFRDYSFTTHTLYDDAATPDATYDLMKYLIKQSRPRDVLVLVFCCHGGETADLNGDEHDLMDEMLHLRGGALYDDALVPLIKQSRYGSETITIVDSCYSGGMTDRHHITISGCQEGTVGWYEMGRGLCFSNVAVPILRNNPGISYDNFIRKARTYIDANQVPQLMCDYKDLNKEVFTRSREV